MKIYIKKVNNKFLFTFNDEILFLGTFTTKKLRQIKYLYRNTELISEINFLFRLPFRLIHKINYSTNQNTFKIIKLEYNNPFAPKHISIINHDVYEIIPHKGMKTSIFKNGVQIGFYEQRKLELLGGQNIVMVLDDNIEKELICTFILAIKCDFRNDYSTISVDIGNFGNEIKAFDYNWKPNDEKKNS